MRPRLVQKARSEVLPGGIVAGVTQWAATIDRRYHDAVIFDLDDVVAITASGDVDAVESAVPLLHRLREARVAVGVYSSIRDCEKLLAATGITELVGVAVGRAETDGRHDPAVVTETATRLGVRPDRCVVVGHDRHRLGAASDDGFSLVIGLDRTANADEMLSCSADTVVSDLGEISVRTGDATISTIPDALRVYSQLGELVTARRAAVFLDFDGTLSDIVEQPESATLVAGASEALRALAAQCQVAVISGRDLKDVRDRVAVDGVLLAGSHGFELVTAEGIHHQNAAATTAEATLAHAADRLAEELGDVPGILLERKRFAVAVHYRNVDPGRIDHLIAAVRRLGRSAGLPITTGRKVVELRPNLDWNKGKTVQWILERMASDNAAPDSDTLPIYIGDDITDEDAFDAVRFDGIGIVVRHDENSDRPSSASFSLETPSAVTQFIQRLADDLNNETENQSDPWELVYEGYDPTSERLREALCTVGNGYVATRGCAPEAAACDIHYPGTYATGVYNNLTDRIAGRTVENESLVNLPNWLSLTFRIDGGPWFSVDDVELLFYRQTFNLRHATLTRQLRFRDHAGRITTLTQERFAAMHEPTSSPCKPPSMPRTGQERSNSDH